MSGWSLVDKARGRGAHRSGLLMTIAIEIAGALAILVAFASVQRRALAATSPTCLLLNLAGGIATAAAAYLERQWGFLILQSVWAVVAAGSLAALRSPRGRRRRDA